LPGINILSYFLTSTINEPKNISKFPLKLTIDLTRIIDNVA